MKILTVTSGKGGVGKTTISLNIARQLSLHNLKTLIIDFDIHNKGTTGLFLPQVTDQSSSVLSIVHESQGFYKTQSGVISNRIELINLRDKLFLLPAARPSEMIQWSKFVAPNEKIIDFFRDLIGGICSKHSIDVVVIDCYGGIDSLTVAAIGLADDTIIVNEPDVVTFSGTLTLYSYLSNEYSQSLIKPKIHFVINRVTFRHTFRFLNAEYQKHLSALSIDRSILAYLPFDKLVMETFGDHPFFTELLPHGLITKKIRLLIGMLWKEESFNQFARYSEKKQKKIYQQTTEHSFADPEKILRGAVSAPLWLMIPLSFFYLLSVGFGSTLPYYIVWLATYFPLSVILLIILFIAVFEPVQISRWLLRYAGYKRCKRKHQGKINRTKQIIFSFCEYLRALVPSLLGIFLLIIIAGLLGDFWSSIGPRNLSLWPGEIYGFKKGGNYSRLQLKPEAKISRRTDLDSANLSFSNISGCKIDGVGFAKTNFLGAQISNAKFKNVDLSYSVLDSVIAYRSTFFNNNFTGASFIQATFSGSSFIFSELGKNNSKNAYFDGAMFLGCKIKDLVLFKANLQGLDFRGTFFDSDTLDECNLKGADFNMATFSNVSFKNADLSGANFSRTKFIGSNSFYNATLEGCSFRGANLSDVDFSGTWLETSDLTGAILVGNKTISAYDLWIAKQLGGILDESQIKQVEQLEMSYPRISKLFENADRFSKGNVDALILSFSGFLKLNKYENENLLDYYYNLIELLLTRNNSGDLNEAEKNLEEAEKKLLMLKPTPKSETYKGYHTLLKFEHAIITGKKEMKAAGEWFDWISNNFLLGDWSWELWNRSFNGEKYSIKVNTKLWMLQHSAKGEVDSETFKFCFYPGLLQTKN